MTTRNSKMKATIIATAIWGVAGLQSAASGSIIDLRDLPGNFDQGPWGQPDTTIYAQSIIADDVFLDEFRFRATGFGGDILFTIMVTGDRVDFGGGLGFSPDFNDIRYTSANMSIPGGGGLTEITVNPNINVTNGERLFFVLNTFTFPASDLGTVRATQFNGPVDQYVPGEFVFINTGGLGAATLQDLNNFNWSHRFNNNEDLAVFVSFKLCPWDCADPADGSVATADLLALLSQWGGPGSCDFDGGVVSTADLLKLLSNWGRCPK